MLRILLIDDNSTDVLLTQIAFEDAQLAHELTIASDGVEGLAALRGAAPDARPDLVLLDLNMPRMGGLEVLEHVKADAALARVPIFVLLASANEEDVWRSRQLRADGFLPKPIDPAIVLELLASARDRYHLADS